MNILVCVKQVPEPETALDWGTGQPLTAAEGARMVMSGLDAHALECALSLAHGQGKDQARDQPRARVEAVTVGPPAAAAVLERARGMGAAAGFHILSPGQEDPPALSVAAWLAAWARGRAYDLILTGAMSQDAMQGQVGPLLAGLLGLDWASLAVKMSLAAPGRLYVEREIEAGRRQCLELDLPALVSVQASPRQPRYPSLSNLLKAKASPPEVIDAQGLPAPAPRQALLGLARPQRRRAGRVLSGSLPDQATELCAILRRRGLL
ncbi:MAG: electron transfer flavoprotein subunit beta/FixA family protein [Pseudomonadota bacterium]